MNEYVEGQAVRIVGALGCPVIEGTYCFRGRYAHGITGSDGKNYLVGLNNLEAVE